MGPEPAQPGLGHGVEGVAQPGVVKIPKQALGGNQGVAKLHRRHQPRKTRQGGGGAVSDFVLGQEQHNEGRQEHGVQSPEGGEPGEIHPQIRPVT